MILTINVGNNRPALYLYVNLYSRYYAKALLKNHH